MKYRDLPDLNPDTPLPGGGVLLAKQPVLQCPQCGESWSANRGDYWASPDVEVTCGECVDDDGHPEPLILAHERTLLVPADRLGEFDRLLEAFYNG